MSGKIVPWFWAIGCTAAPQESARETDSALETDLPEETDSPGETDLSADTDLPSCESWCAQMEEVCPEEALHPHESCMTFCENDTTAPFAVGSLSDTTGNSLGCRLNWLQLASQADNEMDRLQACGYAHASGGDQCGTFCENYCEVGLQTCGEANDALMDSWPETWVDWDTCMDVGGDYPVEVLSGISQTEQHFGYGDTVQCRLHHEQAAVIQGADQAAHFDLHCQHASMASSDDTCSDEASPNLPNYCAFATTFCTGDLALFPDANQNTCMTILGNYVGEFPGYEEGPFESFVDEAGNTLGCLNHWIVLTALDPETYCPIADWDPEHWVTEGGSAVCAPE